MLTLNDLTNQGLQVSLLNTIQLNDWVLLIKDCNQPNCPGVSCQYCQSKIQTGQKQTSVSEG